MVPAPHTADSEAALDQPQEAALDQAQQAGLGDMDVEAFRRAAHATVELMADYLAGVERYPVLPQRQPGELRPLFPASPPEQPESIERILADYRTLVEPNITHWQHPGFFAYFSSSGSGPGILGEMLMATLVANAMLWRTSPVATELEEVTVDWFRQALGLPGGADGFTGFYTDTASTSSLIGLAAARQSSGRDVAAEGLVEAPRLRVYASAEAHSSIEKACMTLGLGRAGLRRIPVDDAYRMDVAALEAAIAEDRAAGLVPCAVVATLGTTGSTSVDPVDAIVAVCRREGLWLHVDAAYAGVVALIPERRGPFAGWEAADSIVINPHKWLFTPLDCSLYLTRRPDAARAAFSLVPEYLRTRDQDLPVHDFNESTPQLGRRFRALKMWFIVRYFGLEGLRSRIEAHIELAQRFAAWVDDEPDAERLAPTPFSTVCFRWRPARFSGHTAEPEVAAYLDGLNEALMARLNAGGEVFLSHTVLAGRLTLRLAVGNLRTEARHVERAWALVRELGPQLDAEREAATEAGAA
ncbi:MAG TPA: pyridoxal-dependent decarboxylase [Candidatus Limnocylindrales bacterium]|nr:pyridoxal-dependent decarboxylase [Candidatus Limnocylindrales bacterium]